MMRYFNFGAALALTIGFAGVSNASISYSTNPAAGSYSIPALDLAVDSTGGQIINLGNDGNYLAGAFDKLLMSPVSGSFSGDGVYDLNEFKFDAGLNRNNPAGPFGYSFTQDLTIGGVTHSITVPFSVSISSSDTLTFLAGAPVFYDLGIVTLTAQALVRGPVFNDGSAPQTGTVQFQVSGVPEPSTVALIGIIMLSLFGFGMMRRRADL